MARTHRDDWIEAGLSLLGREGEAALTLERLCAALGRTKGSFYHHFEGMPALGSAMLAAWEQRHTDVPIAAASRERSVARRRRSLALIFAVFVLLFLSSSVGYLQCFYMAG